MRGRCLCNAPRLRVPARGSRGELVGRQPFEPFVPRAKAMIVRLAKKMMHMLVEALQPVALGHKLHLLGPLRVAFGNRNIALGDGLRGQYAQALKIVRK